MPSPPPFQLANVQAVYSGPEGRLWELLMGQQIHIGGLRSSMDLAERAGLRPGLEGVDFCCATGAGMRFLVRFQRASHMTGVDATATMVELGRKRCQEEGVADRITFLQADVCKSGLPSDQVDFVWGEDAWCYVPDKTKLIAEASRVVKPGGVIAFTDWMEGPSSLLSDERDRLLKFMTFPSAFALGDYREALNASGCTVRAALDTGRFASHVRLYLDMLEQQLTYDALSIIGFNSERAESLLTEMRFLLALAESGKIIQGLVVAEKDQ